MSIFPKYQPVIFEEYLPRECEAHEYIFQSIANHGDTATFQVIVEPCEGTTNIIVNPDFDPSESAEPNWEWTVTGGFTQPGSGACKANDGSSASLFKDDMFVIGMAYKLEIEITSLVGTVQIYNGATLLSNVAFIGTNVINFVATAESLTIAFDNVQHYGCIASATAYPFSPNMSFGIIDSNGDTVAVRTYLDNPEYFTFAKNTVTVAFIWSDFALADECYNIVFADGCTNTNGQFGIFNETFCSQEAGWDVDPGDLESFTYETIVDPNTGELTCSIKANNPDFIPGATGVITSTSTELAEGLCYEITINGATTDDASTITFYAGTATHVFNVNPIAAYPQSFQITCSGGTTFSMEFNLGNASYLQLFGFEMRLCDPLDTVFDYTSQSFKLKDSHACTHVLSLANNEDGMNYVFEGSGFEPSVRLPSTIFDSEPEILREFYHDNLGKKEAYFGEYRKHFFFALNDPIPAWLIDFFHVAFIADNFFVDGTAYFIEGDKIQVQWAETATNFGTFKIEISEKTQLVRNANINVPECGSETIATLSCADLGNVNTGLSEIQRAGLFLIDNIRTGQTTSYEPEDDGERQDGRGSSFLQLSCNNWFGNTNRFTAIDGTQTLIDSLMLDWQTGLMWVVTPFGTYADWETANAAATAATFAGYSDYFLPDINQLESLRNLSVSDTFSYSPLSVMSTPYANVWSSSTNPNATTEAYRINPVNGNVNGLAKSTPGVYAMFCRYFTREDLGL